MVFVQERKSKGKSYLYLDRSVRINNKVMKVSRFLGKKGEISEEEIKKAKKEFSIEANGDMLNLIMKQISSRYIFSYPLTIEEIRKLEEMNLKYWKIRESLGKQDWEDIKKRFVANFVFESNALEGNSLTLKNFSEIVFENKVINSADLREVNDAKNSYTVFSKLFSSRSEITEPFIINLHKKIMTNIDNRAGYKKIPNIILGRNIRLASPEEVTARMKELIAWYDKNKNMLYPLELAFKFHHKFEQIHPFADGNGRVGRMLLNYILIKNRYYPIIIRKTQRNRYLKALQAADNNAFIPMLRFALEKSKETYRKFFEVYYKYA